MNHRPKQRFENMHQQHHYRPAHHFGGAVPQQGPPPNVAQNRMPNAGGAMRAQGMNPRPSHVPQQQQQQQQQPQQLQNQQVQQQHGGGVAVQQHQGYSHVASQGHHSHHPAPMYYAAQQQHGAHPSYIQIPSYALSPTTNQGIPLQTISLQQVPRFTYYQPTQPAQAQQTAQAYYQTANAAPQHHQMYTVPVHYAYHQAHQQHRMNAPTMHPNTHAVANTQQQLQQAPVVAQSHGGVVSAMPAQHQPQHPHPQQQPVVSPQAQPITRQEKSHERKKNILPILDPKTGRHVIDNSPTPAAPNSTPNAESGSAKGASTESAQNSLPSSGDNKQDSQNQVTPQIQEKQDLKPKDEAPEKVKEEGLTAPANDRNKSSAVRAEFFQKIAQASDDTRTTSSSSSGNTNANAETTGSSSQADADVQAVVEPEVEVVTASPPVPSTPTKDKSPSPEPSKQLVASTPVANTSSDDSKDASLVSISPTPIENYATPRSREVISSPSLQPTIEKYAEEEAEEEPTDFVELEDDNDGALPEEVPEPEITSEPVKHNDIEVEVEETTTTVVEPEPVQEEARADSALSDSVKQDESEKGDDGGIEDLGSASEENQPNGHLPLEEGELRDDDESTVADSGNDEQEDTTSSAKGKIKYDRSTLLAIGGRANIDEFKVAEHGLPDLAKDNLNNHIKSHPMAKNSPGGPRDYGRGPRGMPNQGNKGPLSPHQNMHMRMGGGGGMGGMNWGGGIMIPPPPPGRVQPKVQLTLQREEVKLHKAENAWKPATLKRGPTQQEQQQTDEEQSVTDSIVKKTRGILNKLTPDNFEKLVSKFMALPLEDKDERISSVISVVFEKAIDEPSFSTAYAKMVQTVCKTSQETSKKFRKQILDQCQKEFQKSNTDEAEIKEVEQKLQEATEEDEKKQLKLEIDEKKFTSRRRSLGNVRFIGELYKLQMLTPKIMVECVHLLLYAPDDENLECLCKLLATVGQRLDMHLKSIEEQATRGEKPKFCPEPKWMDKTVSMLQQLSESKKLSSRIRFAILDVVELRQNDWKPRRDTNAPKTIEEVRQDAIRQEIEEKRQINSLPPVQNNYGGGGDRDHRSGGSRLPGGQPQKKGSEWSTLPANKASRFQNSAKKPEPSGSTGNPVFGPPSWGSNWGQRNQSGPPSSSQSKSPYPNLPPRLQANSNRFSNLAQDDGPRQPNKSMQNSSDMGNFREPQPPMYPPHPAPPLIIASPTPSNNSSAENSRPVSPKDETVTADTGESVKNIFQEYLSCKKFDDTLHWIKKRFPGNKIDDFIDEISRQVSELSKEEEQKCAGSLVRLLIKNNQIPKEAVIRLMAQGVMQDLPDILIDSPMATSYLAQFLVEVFAEDKNLDWLVQVGDNLIDSDEGDSAWRLLAVNSLNLLKLRKNEEFVQTSFRQTERKNVIPIDEIPWLQDKPIDTLAEQMVKVLSPKLTSESSDEIGQIFQEHSWDVREEATARALTEAICMLTWNSETGNWNEEKLKKLLPLLGLPNKSTLPAVWKQVEEYARRKSIKKDECEGLWSIMYSLNMTTTTD